jgi:protease PrsW
MALAGLATLLLLIGFEVGTVALVTGIVLALLPVPVYVGLALWVDRFEPEPAHLLLWAFFWGATGATLIALVINSTGQAFVGGAFGSEVGQLYGASLSAPVVEEVAKAAALYGVYRWRRLEFDGVLDGLVYAGMVGLGFAFSENILYYSRAALEGGVPLALTFFVRGVLSPFGHPVFTAATGIGFGLAALRAGVAWRSAPIVGLLGAMGLHSLWNTSAGVAGGAGFPAVYFTVMIPVFAGLVAIAVAALFRDRSVIQRYLQPELASGVLSAEDLAILTSLRERRRAVRLAKRQSAAARRARKELQRTATELAFLRRHLDRRPEARDAARAGEEAALVERVRTLRSLLPAIAPAAATAPAGAALVPPAAATGPPAAWYPDPYGQARLRWWDGHGWTQHTAV